MDNYCRPEEMHWSVSDQLPCSFINTQVLSCPYPSLSVPTRPNLPQSGPLTNSAIVTTLNNTTSKLWREAMTCDSSGCCSLVNQEIMWSSCDLTQPITAQYLDHDIDPGLWVDNEDQLTATLGCYWWPAWLVISSLEEIREGWDNRSLVLGSKPGT